MSAKLDETPSEPSDPPAALTESGEAPTDAPGAPPLPAVDRLEDRLLSVFSAFLADESATAPSSSDQHWQVGSLVALLGFDDELCGIAGSLYFRLYPSEQDRTAGHRASPADGERAEMTAACGAALRQGGLCSLAVPIGPGGLLVSLAKACVGTSASADAVGCAVVLPAPRAIGTSAPASVAAQLFHEAPGRMLVAIPAARYADATLLTRSHGVPLLPLGRTGGRELVIRASDGGSAFREVLRISVAALAVPSTP